MIYIYKSKDEFQDYFLKSLEKFKKDNGEPTSIGVSWSRESKLISIHYNLNQELNKANKSINQFEFINYSSINYKIGSPDDCENEDQNEWIDFWGKIREASTLIQLPTVLYQIVDTDQYDLPIENENEIFGKAVVKHFRDYTIEHHQQISENYYNKTIDEISKSFPDYWNEELKVEKLKEATFFNKLDSEQLSFLRKYILKLIDSTTFNVMRAIDESSFSNDCKSIAVTINGQRAEELNLIGNGNLSGEYLDWIDRFSKYEQFQT